MSPPSNGAATPDELVARLIAARAAVDIDRALDCYEAEATIVAQRGQIVTGAEATRAFIEATARLQLVFNGRSIVIGNGLALHQAAWSATLPDGVEVSGCTADVLRRQTDGTWQLAIDKPWGSTIV